jgi:GT2 family glycosyltransferase
MHTEISPLRHTKTTPWAVDVSVIYVNWNSASEITGSIASLRENIASCTYEIIIVDNNSPDGPGTLADDRGIKLILSPDNGGFGAGCNIGAKAAIGKYLLFLNPDTRLLNDAPSELIRFMESHPLAGVTGALVEDGDGSIQFDGGRSLPSIKNEFLQHSTLSFRYPNGRWTSSPYLSDWDHRSTRQVGSVVGACMMLQSDDFRTVGGFDERFFLYCEEVDLCYRIWQSGLTVWYVHTARILHKERQSTLQLYGSISRVVLQNMKSQNLYFRKHGGWFVAFAWRCMVVTLYTARYLLKRDRAHLEYAKWGIGA